jgi:hypothetical protein
VQMILCLALELIIIGFMAAHNKVKNSGKMPMHSIRRLHLTNGTLLCNRHCQFVRRNMDALHIWQVMATWSLVVQMLNRNIQWKLPARNKWRMLMMSSQDHQKMVLEVSCSQINQK